MSKRAAWLSFDPDHPDQSRIRARSVQITLLAMLLGLGQAFAAPPSYSPIFTSIDEDTASPTLALAITDPDPADTHTATLVAQPPGGTVTISGLDVSILPDPDYSGPLTFEITVCDQALECVTQLNTVTVTPVNDPPSAAPLIFATAYETPSAIHSPVIADPDAGDSHTLEVVLASANGAAMPAPGPGVVFTPNPGFSGPATFEFRVCDVAGACSASTLATVTVLPPPGSDPSFTPIAATLAEDASSGVIGLAITDPDPGDTHTVSIPSQPANGSVAVAGLGVIVTPAPNFDGVLAFDLTVCDQTLRCITQPNTVTVTPVNDPPVAADISMSTAIDTPSAPTAPLITDPDSGDAHILEVTTQSADGTATPGPGPTVIFVPNPGFSGITSFWFRVCDAASACSVPYQGTVNVSAFGSPPSYTPIAATIAEDTASGVLGLAITDPDPGDTHTVSILMQPAGGTVALSGLDVTVTPDANYTGNLIFSLEVCDQVPLCVVLANNVVVTPVNDAPDTAAMSFTTFVDTPSAPNAPTIIDPDAGDSHTLEVVASSADGIAVTGPGPSVTFTPNPGYSGVTSFQFRVCDAASACSSPYPASVTVAPPAGAPPVFTPISVTIPEDTDTGILGLSITDPDPGDTHTVSLLAQPAGGSVTIIGNDVLVSPHANFNGNLTFDLVVCDQASACSTQSNTVVVTPVNDPPFTGPIVFSTGFETASASQYPAVLDPDAGDTHTLEVVSPSPNGAVFVAPDVSLSFSPNPGFSGATTFQFRVCDAVDCSAPQLATVTVGAAPRVPPTLSDGNISTAVDVISSWLALVIAGEDPAETYAFELVTPPSVGGVVELNYPQLRYAPAAGFFGPTSFEVRACDTQSLCSNAATVTVTVDNPAGYPSVAAVSITTPEDTASAWTAVTVNDPTPGDTHTLIQASSSPGGSFEISGLSVRFTPFPDFAGTTSVDIRACDALAHCSATRAVEITVTPSNDPPRMTGNVELTAWKDHPSVWFRVPAVSPDGQSNLYVSIITPPTTGVVEIDGADPMVIRYVPDPGSTSDDTFELVVCDPRPTCSPLQLGEVRMDVLNTPPTVDQVAMSTNEDVPSPWYTAVVTDGDPGDTHTLEIRVPSLSGSVEVSGLDMRFVPVPDYSGTTNFRFRTCDSTGACSPDTLGVVVVNPSNDPPTVAPVAITTQQDLASAYVEAAISDPDPGDTHTYQIVSQSANGTADVSVLGMRFVPAAGFQGAASFEFRVCDAASVCSPNQLANVTVTRSNTPPVVAPFALNLTEDTASGLTPVAINDPDPGETHTLSLSAPAAHGTISVSGTSFEYTPAQDWFGADAATLTVCDALAACASFVVDLNVAPVNDAPVVAPLSVHTREDVPSVPVALIVSDVDSVALPTFAVAQQGAGGVASIAAGAVIFTPDPDFSGATSFIVQACDDMMACVDVAVPVIVDVVNDAPLATPLAINTSEDTTSAPETVLFTDSDPFDTHTLRISQNPLHGTAQVEASGTEVSYTPNPDFSGADDFYVEVCDQLNACSEVAVSVTVTPANDPPTSVSLYILTKQGTQSEWVSAVVIDPDPGDIHTLSVLVQPADAVVDVNPTFDAARALPDPGASGTRTFQIQACDLAGACVSAEASVGIVESQSLSVWRDVAVALVADPVLSMSGGQPITSDPIVLRDGAGGVASGNLSVSVSLSADAPTGYRIDGLMVNPGDTVSLGLIDFSATAGRLEFPIAPDSIAGLTPGYGGQLLFSINDPYAPDLTASITLWDPRDSIDVAPQDTAYTRLVDPVRVSATAIGNMCSGMLFVYDDPALFDGYSTDRAYCAVRWSTVPSGLAQSADRASPYLEGYFDSAAPIDSLVYEVGLASFDATGSLFFSPAGAAQTIDFALTDPAPPQITFSPSGEFSSRQQYLPAGQWPSEVGPDVTVGAARARADYPGLVLTATSPSHGISTSESPHTAVSLDIKTALPNLWSLEDVLVRAAYLHAPSVFSEATLSFAATPATPIMKIVRPGVLTNTDPAIIEGNLGAFDYASGTFSYDAAIHGDWTLRLYRINPDRSRDPLSAPLALGSPSGDFALSAGLLPVGTQRMIVVAELHDAGGPTGKTIESSTILASVKDATPIDITLSASRESGAVPFAATLRAKLADSRRTGDASSVEWEYSDDGGATWNPIVREPRYARAFAYSETMLAAASRSYRATTVNRYSGSRFVSNAVDVSAYVLPSFSVVGYGDTFVDFPVDWTIVSTEVLPVEYRWTVKQGYADPTPDQLSGLSNTLSADVATTLYVDIHARFLSSPDVPGAWRKVSKRISVRPPSIRRPLVEGPSRLEIGQTYTYTVKTDHCLDPRLQSHLTLNGRWVMPDGSIQGGNSVSYTPAEGDIKAITYEAWVDGYQAETIQATKRSISFWSYMWPQWYVYSKPLFPFTPGRITYQLKAMAGGYLGDEPLTFHWDIPPQAVIERNDGNLVTLRYDTPGAWTTNATVSDTRGNVQFLTHTFDVTPPPPLGAALSVVVGDSWNRAPADLIARWSVSGLLPGERIQSVTSRLDGAVFSQSTYTSQRAHADAPGTHTVAVDLVSSEGRTASASASVDLIVGDPPVCSINVRGDGVRSLDAQAVCSAPMGILKSFHWWVTYADDGSTQDLGLRGSRILMSSVGLARGISGITLVGVNDKGQESAPFFWSP